MYIKVYKNELKKLTLKLNVLFKNLNYASCLKTNEFGLQILYRINILTYSQFTEKKHTQRVKLETNP